MYIEMHTDDQVLQETHSTCTYIQANERNSCYLTAGY